MQYLIHEDNLQKLSEKLKRIENKCNKYGCTFSYAQIGEEFKEVQHEKEIIGAYGQKQLAKTYVKLEKFIIIEVEGKAIINNWQFIATIEHTEHGNIIRSYSDIEIPEKFKTVSAHCDHCNINRYRKDSYLILNTVTNEIKQVGKSCLQDYTNGLSAEVVSQYASYFNAIAEMNDRESIGGSTRHYINVNEYLCAANDVVKKMGFISKSKAEENGDIPTSQIINSFMFDQSQDTQKHMQKIGFNPETEENKAEVKIMLEWLESQKADSQYIHNLQVACKMEYCEHRDCGLLASLPSAYFKAMKKESCRIARKNAKVNQVQSNHIGTIGDKIQLTNVFIDCIARYETEYGITKVYKIIDADSNIYVWKSANNIETGENKNIKGTIKTHNIFRGEKQTELTRCKVF